MEKRNAVIVAYGRSAVSRAKDGPLKGVHPIEWGAETLEGVLRQIPQLEKSDIDDMVLGCARTVNKCAKNIARLICLKAGMESVSAQTINRFCASGLQAISTCANAIAAGDADIMIAGGIECMSMDQALIEGYKDEILDAECPGAYMDMGITAENVAERKGITREEMDAFAAESHRKAAAAQAQGLFRRSIIPVHGADAEGKTVLFDTDQGIRPDTTTEKLAGLKPCFKENGVVTAATSSQTDDSAAFAILMSEEKARSLGCKPIARMLSFATAGCDPETMGLGPIFAAPKALGKADLTMDRMDVIELNEAFAAQAIPCIRTLDMPPEKVNPWGGAIALGHPMGATGVILTIKALDYLRENGGTYAMVTMCVGGGQGAAGIFEFLE